MVNRITNRWICNCGACDVDIAWLNGQRTSCKKCNDSYQEITSDKNLLQPYHTNPDYIDYLEQCRAICNRIYICRNISLNEAGIIEELKKIDKLQNHKCFKD